MNVHTELQVRVAGIWNVADTVKRFRFVRVDGQPMPVFSGGAHVVVGMRDGDALRRNAYSLMSDPHDTSGLEISVLRVEQSRGGSHFLHDRVQVGDELTLSQPVNLFPADQRARRHLLLAGGIGITPFIAMMAQMERAGQGFELHYAIRTRAHGAYWQELLDRYGPARVKLYVDADNTFIAADRLLANQPLGTHLYVCGPKGMIAGVLGTARSLGWPAQNLHSEEFLAPPPGSPFTAVLKRSGRTVQVQSHQSILEAVEEAGVDAPYLCRGGACGQCETRVLDCAGSLEHNDHYLEPEEKASGAKIMICVSRVAGREITLDL